MYAYYLFLRTNHHSPSLYIETRAAVAADRFVPMTQQKLRPENYIGHKGLRAQTTDSQQPANIYNSRNVDQHTHTHYNVHTKIMLFLVNGHSRIKGGRG